MHREIGENVLCTGKKQSVETTPEAAQILPFLNKNFKLVISNIKMFKTLKETISKELQYKK